ncbi:aminoglycoside phosphotransferase family protein [Kangsaoukella pontilimi]|uniref:aminoglycoside phosphotransferase family protein n=1 Tax=Kangsaoukella pontilimi TaxID=2691042 RepID=UPI001371E9CF|nr:phosphotransferase [Kangsaoukella pontilimi]
MGTRFELPSDVREAFGLSDRDITLLPQDASSRSYGRVTHPEFGACLVLSDNPEASHFRNYLSIGPHLRAMGLSAPRIHATDTARGFALIEDFGLATYARELASGADEGALYDLATDVLIHLHGADSATKIDIPPYDMDLLLSEAARFTDWCVPAIGIDLSDAEKAEHQALWRATLSEVADRRDVLVMRDFHIDNLLLLPERNGPARCGLLDFQDGLIGAAAYDLVSLTQDARRDVPREIEARVLERYLAARPETDRADLMADFWRLGAQRHAKVAGLFHRLDRQAGKPGYLRHVPRVLGQLERALTEGGLSDLAAFYDRVAPSWRDHAAKA